jgi:hypothetical protein
MGGLWRRLRPRQWLGGALALIGAGLTVLLALVGNQTKPPPASTQALIAFLAILAQVGAAWAFAGDGKADPTLAQRCVARLIGLAQRAEAARLAAETLNEAGGSAADMKRAMGQMSVHLSYIEEGYVNAIEDWRVFHPGAVEKAEGKSLGS